MFPSFLLPQASRLTCGGTSLAVALLITATPLSPTQAQTGQGVIRISGSSTVFPITQEAIRAFRKTAPGRNVRFELQETGTSAGFRDFCSGKVPIANASRPISSKELKACEAKGVKFIELPIAFDALTVAVHPKNTWASQITVKELNTLWNRQATGRVKRWKQVNSAWPDRPIKLCGAGSDSGTFDYFNKAITGDAENSRSDYTASEDDNVLVRCVANDPNALGYFGFGYYLANQNKLRSLAIVGRKGATRPSVEAVQKERYTPSPGRSSSISTMQICFPVRRCRSSSPSLCVGAPRLSRPQISFPFPTPPTSWWKASCTAMCSAPPSVETCRSD